MKKVKPLLNGNLFATDTPNRSFCMAPWTHTYLTPQTERRLCCASRQSARFTKQYVDHSSELAPSYEPQTLDEYWNGEQIRSVRRRMLAGETLPECEVCNDQLLNVATYRSYFNGLFGKYVDQAFEQTDDQGRTTMPVISFDYRHSNLCNFKCRTCGDQLSSAWEEETRRTGEWSTRSHPWMVPAVKQAITDFHNTQVRKEFEDAITSGRLEEVYWVGGEPLLWELHWTYMKQMVDTGLSKQVYVRYNTNLSRIEYRGVRLFEDLLVHFKDYQICASIDGTEQIGEWIRSGLVWTKWLSNFKKATEFRDGHLDRAMMDITLTLPGLFDVPKLVDLSNQLGVRLLTKVMFAFDPSIVISPLALPQDLLHPLLDDLIAQISPHITPLNQSMLDTLVHLRSRPTFDQTYTDSGMAFLRGRKRMREIADRRGDGTNGRTTLDQIYLSRPEIWKWWQQ